MVNYNVRPGLLEPFAVESLHVFARVRVLARLALRLVMNHHAGRLINRQPPALLEPQAQVHVLAAVPEPLIESTRLVEARFSRQHAGGRNRLIDPALVGHGIIRLLLGKKVKAQQRIVVPAIRHGDPRVLYGPIWKKQLAPDGRDGGVAFGQKKERSEPIGLRFSVVVEEQTVASEGRPRALIAGFGETRVVPIKNGAQSSGRLLGAQKIRSAVSRAVVHDDDLVSRRGRVRLERAEALACQIELVESRDDDRDLRHFHRGRRGGRFLRGPGRQSRRRRGGRDLEQRRHREVRRRSFSEEPVNFVRELPRQGHVALRGHHLFPGHFQQAGLFLESVGVPDEKHLAAAQRGLARHQGAQVQRVKILRLSQQGQRRHVRELRRLSRAFVLGKVRGRNQRAFHLRQRFGSGLSHVEHVLDGLWLRKTPLIVKNRDVDDVVLSQRMVAVRLHVGEIFAVIDNRAFVFGNPVAAKTSVSIVKHVSADAPGPVTVAPAGVGINRYVPGQRLLAHRNGRVIKARRGHGHRDVGRTEQRGQIMHHANPGAAGVVAVRIHQNGACTLPDGATPGFSQPSQILRSGLRLDRRRCRRLGWK